MFDSNSGSGSDSLSDDQIELLLNTGTRITKEQAEKLVKNLDHLHEGCRRNKFLMPDRNSAIVTRDYCHGVSETTQQNFFPFFFVFSFFWPAAGKLRRKSSGRAWGF